LTISSTVMWAFASRFMTLCQGKLGLTCDIVRQDTSRRKPGRARGHEPTHVRTNRDGVYCSF
jgi:hypothetical protein